MRGPDEQTSDMSSDLSPEPRVRAAPPLRAIRRRPDEAVATLSPRLAAMDSAIGRPSIPPEPLRRAWLRPALDPVRSERWLRAEIDDRVLYRWFVGPGMDAPIGAPTTVSKKRERLLASDVASAFFDAVVTQACRGRAALR